MVTLEIVIYESGFTVAVKGFPLISTLWKTHITIKNSNINDVDNDRTVLIIMVMMAIVIVITPIIILIIIIIIIITIIIFFN